MFKFCHFLAVFWLNSEKGVSLCECCLLQNGNTALSIAKRLGYISVVDTLKVVTEEVITTTTVSLGYMFDLCSFSQNS